MHAGNAILPSSQFNNQKRFQKLHFEFPLRTFSLGPETECPFYYVLKDEVWFYYYRSGTVNSKSFVGKVLLRNK